MAQENYTLITDVGLSKHAGDIATGNDLVITEMAFGDADRIPQGGETSLGNEVARYPITAFGRVPGTQNEMFFEVYVGEAEGPYAIRETALFDDDGDMVAIGREGVPINKVLPSSGRAQSFTYRMQVAFSRLDNIVVAIAPGAFAYVPFERRIDTGFGLKGGGALDQDRTFEADTDDLDGRYLVQQAIVDGTGLIVTENGDGSVSVDIDFASLQEHQAGVLSDKSAHPAGVRAAIASAAETQPQFFFGLM